MENLIIIIILISILSFSTYYIYKSKKKGNKCIGCPNSSLCSNREKKNCNQ